MDQRVAHGDCAVKFLAVVIGRVLLAVEFKRGGHVIHGGDWRDDGLQPSAALSKAAA